ncbi:hypothetical protein GCM10022403_087780 [Streptomyces coacervatus]|uniref:Terpene synthase n=1 Tax=Streptomyces coacervatus TaxID=647381 RepID=A0ABP7JDD5_9ACTN|nr:hypothetical protein [Streptomyces coacervatus]MDF2273461.1 hypothetical protein [Streptomyces coacervatus]
MVQSVPPLKIPACYCPIPSLIHPNAAEIDACSVNFLARFGLCEEQQQRERVIAGLNRVAGLTIPRGDQVAVQVASDLAAWIFAFDDICDEGPLGTRPGELIEAMSRLQRAIESPELLVQDDPFAQALRDIRLRLNAVATPVQVARWVDAMRGYFFVEAYKACNIARNVAPNLSDYAFIRVYAAGALAFAVLPHIAEGIDLPSTVWEDRRIRALTEMADSVTMWDSDIFSYAKESHRSGDGHNLIDAVRNTYGYSSGQALKAAVAMRDRVMCRFLQLREEVTAEGDPLIRRYLQGLGHYIRGVLDWCLITDRYVYLDGLSSSSLAFHTAGWRDTPSDDSPEPLPIPSIAWWWSVGATGEASRP